MNKPAPAGRIALPGHRNYKLTTTLKMSNSLKGTTNKTITEE